MEPASNIFSETDISQYSIGQAIRVLLGVSGGRLEREVSDQLSVLSHHRSHQGILIPWQARQMDTSGGLKGDPSARNIGEALVERSVLGQMGAMIQTGLVTDLNIGGATDVNLAAVAEDAPMPDSVIGTEGADVGPVTVGGQFRLTRRLMNAGAPIMDAWVNRHLMAALVSAVDGFGVLGGGGILGIHPTAVAVTAPATQGGMATLELTVLDARGLDMDVSSHGYVIGTVDWANLRVADKTTGGADIIQNGPTPGTHTINGYNAWPITGPVNNPATNVRLFGNFSKAWVGIWGAIEVVDVQTANVASGQRHFNAMVDMNAHPMQKAAFVRGS